jgi:Kdo2-lipid IVA lauroyltransferase/acyltransferase
MAYFFPTGEKSTLHYFAYFLIVKVFSYRRKVVRENLLRAFPELQPEALKALENKYYHKLVRYTFEALRGFSLSESELRNKLKFKGEALVHESLKKGRSVIILAAHYGNWEWFSILLPKFIPSTVFGVYKPMSNPYSEEFFKKKRGRFGLKLIPKKEILKHMLRHEGAFTTLLIADQSPPASMKGIQHEFMGIATLFDSGPEKLHKKFDTDVYYLYVEVNQDGYDMRLIPFGKQSPIIDQYIEILEKQIRQSPEYWIWSHKRWKHQLD